MSAQARGVRHRDIPRKQVIQPHLPVRLPCYDFTPIIEPTFDGSLPVRGWATGFGCSRLSWCDGRCVQGPGTYLSLIHISEPTRLRRISYAVFCLKKKKKKKKKKKTNTHQKNKKKKKQKKKKVK